MSDKYLRSEKQNLLNAIGTEHCWGWSPAVDMLDILAAARNGNCNRPAEAQPVSEVPPAAQPAAPSKVDLDDLDALLASDPVAPAATATSTGPDDLHVLLLGCGDVRTVVQTVCKLRRHKPNGRVHLYLYEPNLRTHCRNLVLLQMLFDRLTMDELEDRTSMFLETFGNALIRDITAAHLKAATTRALKLLEKNDGYLAEFFNFDEMKMKERDFIEHQLRHWVSDTSRFDVAAQWDHRVRTEMAERYDNKTNIIDWDFHMNLMEYTHLIKFPEYREWRVSGQAFDYARINPRKQFKYDYTVPNKSLAHFDRLGRGVYNGDVKYGPFYALGCDTENSHLLHRGIEGTVKYGNGVIAMHNVRAWLYELATQKEWPWAEHKFAWDDPEQYNFLPEGTPKTEELSPLMPNVAIHCLGLELERFLLHLKEFTSPQVKLDAAFISCGCSNFLDAPLFEAMRDDGVIVCETIKFVLDAVDDSKDAFIQKLNGQAGASGWSHQPSLTARLHKRQPAAKEHTTEPSATQIRADQRFMKPMQVVYVKR